MQYTRKRTFGQTLTDAFSSVTSNRSISILFLFVILAALPVTILLLNTQTKYIGHAAGTNDLFVSTSGSDSNPCTQAAPCATIQHAANLTTPGTTVHVAPGTYNQAVSTSTSGTTTAPIVYISDTKWGAQIQAGSNQYPWYNTANYITISGFDITGTSARIGILTYGANVTISGNHIHDIPGSCTSAGGAGIDPYSGTATKTTIIGNIVNNVGGYPTPCTYVHGIYVSSPNAIVQNNIVYNNAGDGIITYHAATADTIANNLVFANSMYGIGINTNPPDNGGANGDYFIVSNNIVRNNGYYGIMINTGGEGPHNQYLNNILYANTYPGFAVNGSAGTPSPADQNTLTVDPQLVNYQPDGSGNYHLATGSPAIDSGTSVGAPSYDFDGISRPQGAGTDIGAFQYLVAATATPTVTPTPMQSVNLIQNGSFENTGTDWLAPWGFQANKGATISQGTMRVDGLYSAKAYVKNASSADSAVQLYQGNVPLIQGRTYTITFWAKSGQTRTIRPAVSHGASPWTSYFSQSVSLTTVWQKYTLSFTAPQTDSNAMLLFNLANATGYVWIDAVSLQ